MNNKGTSIMAFMFGAGIGAVLGVLFAPDAGNNTRDKLTYQLTRYKSELEELVRELMNGRDLPANEARSEGNKVISEAKTKAENLLNDVNKLIDQINQENNN